MQPQKAPGLRKGLLAHAAGIAAEILFRGAAAKKIGTESPARCAHIT
jgi:hypothetical protein